MSVSRAALTPAGPDAYRLETPVHSAATSPAEPPPGSVVVPVVREELEVGKRAVDRGGVRVRVVPSEREEVVDVPLEHRHVRVERVPVGREVEGPVPAREEDGVLIFSVVEEVVVVQKKWMLREEVRVRVEQSRTHAREAVTLRTESAVVERLGGRDEPNESPGRDAAATDDG